MYEKVLVPLDGSTLAEFSMVYAKNLAIRCETGIVLLHICRSIDPNIRNAHKTYVEDNAKALIEDLGAAGSTHIEVNPVVLPGEPASEILHYSEQNQVDLIAMTTHGRSGLSRWMRGGVADKVVRHSQVPIRLLRSNIPVELIQKELLEQRILVLLDGSSIAEKILPYVVRHGKIFNAQVILLRVCVAGFISADYPEGTMRLTWEEHVQRMRDLELEQCNRYLDEVAKRLTHEGLDVKTESIVSVAPPAQEIINYMERNPVDLLAMTTHGSSGIARLWMGSVADSLLREVSTPLLLIRSR